MAIKIDMEKAFDFKEWNFLLIVLACLSFHQTWIDWISECICTLSFSVIINGKPCGHFNPLGGLRQGDPLSPFLFIIVNEFLSRLISMEEHLGNIRCIIISKNGHSLTHLLFADDLTLFGPASIQNAQSFIGCLDEYSSWSSQKINVGKSTIQFNKNSSNSIIRDVKEILQFIILTTRVKYLDLPLSFDAHISILLRNSGKNSS